MKVKQEIKESARLLRQEGKSFGQIAKQLSVSRSAAYAWTHDIVLSQEQIDKIVDEWKAGSSKTISLAWKTYQEKCNQFRKECQEEGKRLAKNGDPIFVSGCMLYWAEGTKSATTCILTNSDPNMLTFFVSFLKKCLHVIEGNIKVRCHYYGNENITNIEVEKYWQDKLSLPPSSFIKTTFQKMERKCNAARIARTKFGVARIVVHDIRIVQTIYGAIQEIAGFENLEWIAKKD